MIRPSESKIKKKLLIHFANQNHFLIFVSTQGNEQSRIKMNRSEACKWLRSEIFDDENHQKFLRQFPEIFLFLTLHEEHAIFLGSGEYLLLCAPLPDFLQTFASENSVTPLAPDKALSKSRIILKYKIKTWTKNLVSMMFFGVRHF